MLGGKFVYDDDKDLCNTMYDLFDKLPAYSSLKTIIIDIDVPEIPEPKPGYGKIRVFCSWDTEYVDHWIAARFYQESPNGDLHTPQRDAVFCDMENVGTRRERWTGHPGTIQLGTRELTPEAPFECLIVQVCKMHTMPSTLSRLLADVRISKVWHGFAEDIENMRTLGLELRGCLKINNLSRRLLELQRDHDNHLQKPPLGHLLKLYLNLDRDTANYPEHHWDETILHPWKVRYGAYDTWAIHELMRNLIVRFYCELGKEEGKKEVVKVVGRNLEAFEIGGIKKVAWGGGMYISIFFLPVVNHCMGWKGRHDER